MKRNANARRRRPNNSDSNQVPRFNDGVFSALIPEIQRAIAAEGYKTPTPIQEKCIRPLLDGKDILGSAQTGTCLLYTSDAADDLQPV